MMTKTKADFTEIIKTVQFLLMICIVSTLPFNIDNVNLNGFFIILLILNSIILSILSKEKINYSSRLILLLFAGVYIIHLMGLFYSCDFTSGKFELQKKLSLIIFPVIFFFTPTFYTSNKIQIILNSFVVSCVLVCVYCITVATYRFMTDANSSVFFYQKLGNLAGMHTTYLAMYCCFAFSVLLYNFHKPMSGVGSIPKIFSIIFLVLLAIFIVMLQVRLQLLIWILGLAIYLIYMLKAKFSFLISILISGIVMIPLVLGVLSIPSMRERIKEGFNYNIGERWGEQQVRGLIWKSAVNVIREHPIVGVGTGCGQETLQKYYMDHEYSSLIYLPGTRYNAHNQFLEITVELGFIGLFILLLSLGTPFIKAWKEKNILYLIFFSIFILSCISESMLERQNGVVFFALFNSLLYMYRT